MAFNPQEHMMPLKGKDYLQVMWRLVWFRGEHPDWHINTEIVEHVYGDHAVVKANIIEPKTEMCINSAYGSESKKEFNDYLEKAETKAVGRALAMLGYGTQFAPELDEGERIVDSPVDRKKSDAPSEEKPVAPKEEKPVEYICTRCKKKITKEIGGKKIGGKDYCKPCIELIKNADKA